MELVQGARLAGRFKIVASLGTGQHGPIFLAKDGKLNDTLIALKVFNTGALSSKKQRAQLHACVNALQALNCGGIVKPLEYVEQNDVDALVMEYVEGQDLEAHIEQNHFTLDQTIALLKGITAQVNELHENGFVHNEITPAHIMLTSDGTIRLCGFPQPLGTETGGAFPLSLRPGKAYYHSPEFLKSGVFHRANDLFALGVLGEELLLKTKTALKTSSTATQIWKETIVRRELALLVETASARHPEDRYQIAAEFLKDLEDIYLCIPQRRNGTLFVFFSVFYVLLVLGVLYLVS